MECPTMVYRCKSCGRRLDLSQPNVEDPENLIGFCEPCNRRYVVQSTGDYTTDAVFAISEPPAPRRRQRPGARRKAR
jgi:predicted nucleic acid-binding Zn ribbon protein